MKCFQSPFLINYYNNNARVLLIDCYSDRKMVCTLLKLLWTEYYVFVVLGRYTRLILYIVRKRAHASGSNTLALENKLWMQFRSKWKYVYRKVILSYIVYVLSLCFTSNYLSYSSRNNWVFSGFIWRLFQIRFFFYRVFPFFRTTLSFDNSYYFIIHH